MSGVIQEMVETVVDSATALFLPDACQEGSRRRPLSPAARHIDEWHEDMGDVLWWTNPVTEAPYVGSPLDRGRGYELGIGDFTTVVNLGGWPGYHEWWTPLPAPPDEFTPARAGLYD